MNRRIGALAVALAAALIAAGPLAAQDATLETTTETQEQARVRDGSGLTVEALSERYGVEAAEIEALVADGYRLAELRFALELAANSGSTLEDALAAMAELQGLGWGAMNEALGVEKGHHGEQAEGTEQEAGGNGHRGGPAGQGGGNGGGEGSGSGGGNGRGKGGH